MSDLINQEEIKELPEKYVSSSQIVLVRLGEVGEVMFAPFVYSPLYAIQQNPGLFLALYREMTQAIINYGDLIKEGE